MKLNNKNINSNNLYIFDKYVNNNYKSISFNERVNKTGNTKYFPPVSKEWKNSIYVFNPNNIKNLPTYNVDINSLIKCYFNLYFKNKFLNKKSISDKSNRLSLNKIFVSKAEVKHTNSKAIVTVYAYNREKIALLKRFKKAKKLLIKIISFLLICKENKIIWDNYSNVIKSSLYKKIKTLRRLKLKLSLNKYKFEEIFLYKLSKFIGKLYNKKIELNVVNLKSITFNSDIFTKILTLKLKNRRAKVLKMMSVILNKAVLPKVNRITEKGAMTKSIDFNLIENKYTNLNLNSIIRDNNLDDLLNELYYSIILNKNSENGYEKIYENIFNSIKYKNMGGIRLEVKGRLTKRYRADRAIFKVKWKGGLKNIDSSYKGLSTVNMRGYIRPNLEYSMFTSKRRIGAFAVKGWISGK